MTAQIKNYFIKLFSPDSATLISSRNAYMYLIWKLNMSGSKCRNFVGQLMKREAVI